MRKKKQIEALQAHVEDLHAMVPAEYIKPGAIARSPFIEQAARPRRSLIPWRKDPAGTVYESAVVPFQQPGGMTPILLEAVGNATRDTSVAPRRKGFLADIPRGGANEKNQGWSQIGGVTDRKTLMGQLQMLYASCSVSSACVDTIARTCSAGGMDLVLKDETTSMQDDTDRVGKPVKSYPPQVQKALDLFSYTNPQQNFRQLMRTIFTDLCVYGDSFVEVVWAFDEPIALYNLPCADMLIDADEHGVVNKYIQITDTRRKSYFQPREVLHIKFDSPRGSLYGLGPTEKVVHNITTWLFTQGLLKSIMRRGNPPNVAFKWDLNLAEKQVQKFDEQYRTKNLGPDNVGNPVNLMGETDLHEFKPNQIAELLATLERERDAQCTGYGVPPAKIGVIESGNLGGGTGTSQDKTFKVNTCGPLQELVLEAFTFSIIDQGFGIKDWRCKFEEIDWRDDETIEKIRIQRVERGAWTPNRYRDEVGEAPVEGGDDAVIILTRDVIPVRDVAVKSLAELGLAAGSPPPQIGLTDKLVPAGTPPKRPAPKTTTKNAPSEDLIEDMSDAELLAEVNRRGLQS